MASTDASASDRDLENTDTVPAVTTVAGDHIELVTVSAGHYSMGAEIARGGMGRVLAARDLRHGRTVAIKELLPGFGTDVLRFEREAMITARLQHPAIVPVYEAGRWPDGEPFYAMKLVSGRPLDRVVAEAETLRERIALLPNVIAVTEALAYAHDLQIVHRDLKPSNVLVGRFGETVVIDWGLAKELRGPDTEPPVRLPPTRTGDLTVAGNVMGTPQYMPLEQALGEAVDQRADVYALGALLYHVLAGVAPYDPAPYEVVIARVQADPPLPLERRVDGVPRDLIAIVDKAMARSASDRYPSAKELAADLVRFQTGKLVSSRSYGVLDRAGRWLRRHRAIAAVIAFALFAIAAISVASIYRVVRERDRANTDRDSSDALVHRLLTDLEQEVSSLARPAVLEKLALPVIERYDAIARSESLSSEQRVHYALALRVLGKARLNQGRVGEAAESFDRARDTLAAVLREAPGDIDAQRALADVYLSRSNVTLTLGGDAEPDARAARDLARQVRSELGDDVDAALTEVSALSKIARAASVGDREAEARDMYVEAERLARRLVERDPRDASAAYALTGVLVDKAEHEKSRAELEPAHVILVEALAIARTHAHAALFDAMWQDRLAAIAHDAALVDLARGAKDSAAALLDEAVEAIRSLRARDPDNLRWSTTLARMLVDAGAVAVDRGDLVRARAFDAEAAGLVELVLARDAANLDARYRLAWIHWSMSQEASASHDDARAEEARETALSLERELVARAPESNRYALALSEWLEASGEAHLAGNDVDGATRRFDERRELAMRWRSKEPKDDDWAQAVAETTTNLAKARIARDDRAGAIAMFRESVDMMRALADRDPNNHRKQTALGVALDNLAEAMAATGDRAGAAARYRESLAIAAAGLAASPADTSRAYDVVESYVDLVRVEDGAPARDDARRGLDALRVIPAPLTDEGRAWGAELEAVAR